MVKNSGAIDVTFEECKQDEDYAMETDSETFQRIKHSETRCHQGTQAKLFSLCIADVMGPKAKKNVYTQGTFV